MQVLSYEYCQILKTSIFKIIFEQLFLGKPNLNKDYENNLQIC